MKKTAAILLLIIISAVFSPAEETVSFGISAAFGGRYDPVRMCAGSPAGVPGGPAGEFFAFIFEYRFGEKFGIGLYLPIARPILFAAAFQMLQFLPEISFTYHLPLPNTNRIELVGILGTGVSLHYGPDYRSDLENRGENFFASGPRVSLLIGPAFMVGKRGMIIVGIKPYFEYLKAVDGGTEGPVIGGEADVQFRILAGG